MTIALFDLDNTLIDRQEAVANWARSFGADHGFDPATEAQLAEALSERAYPATFARLRDELGLTEPAVQLWTDYVQGIAAAVKVRPHAIEGIEQLRATGWKVGILTNGASDIQRAKISEAGLAKVVDAIAISDEIGARKPDPTAFHTALALCGNDQKTKAWMVGDNPQGDIGGAQQAGLRTIWLRGRAWPEDLTAADHSVDAVTDAIEILLTEGTQ